MENNDIIAGGKFKFIPYNTGMPQMPLPEYGRNIQNMVDYCVMIPDKEERTECAYAIVDIMKKLFPENVGEGGDLKNLWDHLNIMARFELDIDFPCEVITAENANPVPEVIPYKKGNIRYRHYGRSVENIVRIVADMEPGEERDKLILLLANQMKKLMLTHNPEGVDDAKILRDLYEFSDGKINLNPETFILHEYHQASAPAKQKKVRKRKK